MTLFDYDYEKLLDFYSNLGIKKGSVVYITGNFGRFGRYAKNDKESILRDHFQAIYSLLGDKGTIVVPTHSWSLFNTDNVFDINETISETGPFSEYIRNKEGSVRQLHPFSSSTAFGYKAREICSDNSRHVYGYHSPFQRMLDNDAFFLSVGQKIQTTISLVHHIEFLMGVPYRYSKEFIHPCKIGKSIENLPFYIFALRKDCDIRRDRNRKFLIDFESKYNLLSAKLGRSFGESLRMKDFLESATNLLKKDIYNWLEEEPKNKPFRN